MVKSLRWRLQIWYALVMILVVAGLSVTLYERVHSTTIARINAQLEGSARYLEGTLRMYPRFALERALPAGFRDDDDRPNHPPPREFDDDRPNRPPPRNRDDDRPPPREFDEEQDSLGDPQGPRRRPPPNDRPPGGPNGPGGPGGPRNDPPPRRLSQAELAERLKLLPSNRQEDHPYFAIWRADGSILKSEPQSDREKPIATSEALFLPVQRGKGVNIREVILSGPNSTAIVVGRSIDRELNELNRLGWQIAGIGAIALVASLGGGWLIAKRIWKPLDQMSSTAEKISGERLSERIDVARLDQELQPLAEVLNAMFARLQEAFSRQTQFTSDASHELRTPLTVLQTNLELSLSRARTPEEYQETLKTCLTATARMKRLIQDLLTLARADQNAMQLNDRVDVAAAASDMVKSYQELAAEKSVTVLCLNDRSGIASEKFLVQGQESLLMRVMGNLIENALRYTPAGGRIELSVGRKNLQIEITVTDTGCGIANDQLPRVFQRFYRVDMARARESGGFGLGLAICHNIIEQHGGTIRAESTVGKGTTMRISLPEVRKW